MNSVASLLEIFPIPTLTSEQSVSLLPLVILSITAVLVIIVGAQKSSDKGRTGAMLLSLFGMFLSATVTYKTFSFEQVDFLSGTLLFDYQERILSLVLHLCAVLGLLVNYGYDKREELMSEIYGLLPISLAGMILMVSTNHLLFMFISLEIMSLAIYVMVAMRRNSKFSAEAGLKYFILGGLASAFLLYGSALLFGASGSFNLVLISQSFERGVSPIFYVGLMFVMVGLLFKVGAFPFHSWIPDVYQGATTSVTGFMGAAVKLVAFMALTKVSLNLMFASTSVGNTAIVLVVGGIAAVTIIFGNFVALKQNELKRMLAYSTIAHTGYLLLGILSLSGSPANAQYIMIYLVLYAFSNIGIFALIVMLEKSGSKDIVIDDLAGLWNKYPMISIAMTIFLLSMAGIPLTSGFIGKYLLFAAAVSAKQIVLVVLAVLASVVSVYYYLRVIITMFMKEPQHGSGVVVASKWIGCGITVAISVFITIQMGIFPAIFIK